MVASDIVFVSRRGGPGLILCRTLDLSACGRHLFLKTQLRSGTSFLFSTFSLIEWAISGSAIVASQYTTLLVESGGDLAPADRLLEGATREASPLRAVGGDLDGIVVGRRFLSALRERLYDRCELDCVLRDASAYVDDRGPLAPVGYLAQLLHVLGLVQPDELPLLPLEEAERHPVPAVDEPGRVDRAPRTSRRSP